jgi:hypothetical protein
MKERTAGKLTQLMLECRSRAVVGRGDMIEENIKMCRVLYPLLPHTLPGFECEHPCTVVDICPVDGPVNILSGSPVKDPL